MKNIIQLLTFATTLVANASVFAQGSGVINFGNLGAPPDRRIWVNSSGAVGDGVLAAGTSYKIALYYGSVGTPEIALTQVGAAVSFLTGTAAGTFAGGNRTVTYAGTVNGDVVTVQARAWASIPGVPDTYESILAAGIAGDSRAGVGKGPVFDDDTSRPGDPTDPATPIGTHAGWRGFAIVVPEPSIIALAALGAGALLTLRRRK